MAYVIDVIWALYCFHHSSRSSFLSVSSLWTSDHKYNLEKSQSYGFFTDIDSETWRRHQQQAHYAIKEESIYYNTSYPNDKADTNPAAWLMTNVHPFFTCPNLRRLGGHGDGAKWTCDPHRFMDDCLIYSVGSSGVYTFEDTIAAYSRNQCEIYVFDSEPTYARINDTILRNIQYHAWGLQSSRVVLMDNKKEKVQVAVGITVHESI